MRFHRWVRRGASAAGLLLILATLLPLIPSNEWWIRVFDFPRVQIAALLAILTAGVGAAGMWRTSRGLLLIVALAVALAYQMARIVPYTAPYPEELPGTDRCAAADRIRYMEANVLQHNRNAAALIQLVDEQRPDILLLTETDRWWVDHLHPLAGNYPYIVAVPLHNTYGMTLLSRRRLMAPEIRYLLEADVPSIRTGVELASGRRVDLYGLHPRPPKAGQDTSQRDAELVIVGREVRQRRQPAIVAGDMNDVAWSDTTRLFQEVSGLLDPRVGRQLMPTFPADLPLLRWPLDYVFVSPGFSLLGMQRLRDFGSDHLPIVVELCAEGLSQPALPPPALEPEVKEEVQETVEEGREEASE